MTFPEEFVSEFRKGGHARLDGGNNPLPQVCIGSFAIPCLLNRKKLGFDNRKLTTRAYLLMIRWGGISKPPHFTPRRKECSR